SHERDRPRLLRPAQIGFTRLRVDGLRVQGIPTLRCRQTRHPRQRGARRRAFTDRASLGIAVARPRGRLQDARADTPADVRRRDSGGHRRQHHRARECEGLAQERAGEVLRRRHHPQEEAAREAEGREEADEAGGLGRDSPGSLSGRAPSRGPLMNFALILFLLLLVSFVAWIADRYRFRPARLRAANTALEAFDAHGAGQVRAREGEQGVRTERQRVRESMLRQPWWLEYTAGLFPVILIVFVIRSF